MELTSLTGALPMNRETKKYYVLLSGLLFFFFFTWSSSFSLISLWLNQKIGLKGAETGLIFSAISLVALCAQPLYGFIQDKLGLRKHLLQFLGVMLLLTGPFFIYIYAPLLASSLPLGALVGGVFIGATFFAGIGALESYTERVSRISGFEFGRARMWGSLGWASATFWPVLSSISIRTSISGWPPPPPWYSCCCSARCAS